MSSDLMPDPFDMELRACCIFRTSLVKLGPIVPSQCHQTVFHRLRINDRLEAIRPSNVQFKQADVVMNELPW